MWWPNSSTGGDGGFQEIDPPHGALAVLCGLRLWLSEPAFLDVLLLTKALDSWFRLAGDARPRF